MAHSTAHFAALYLKGKGQRPTTEERATFGNWLATQFNRIRGIVDFTSDEVSPEELMANYDLTGRLLISTAYNVHPHWLPVENAQFRAIHDWHHIQAGAGFDMAGEIKAYQHAAAHAPVALDWILFSEIVLQAAAAIHTGSFQRQKLVRV